MNCSEKKTFYFSYSEGLIEAIGSIVDEEQLKGLVRSAVVCRDLAAVRQAIVRG